MSNINEVVCECGYGKPIESFSKDELFEMWCKYNGYLGGCYYEIKSAIEEIYDIDDLSTASMILNSNEDGIIYESPAYAINYSLCDMVDDSEDFKLEWTKCYQQCIKDGFNIDEAIQLADQTIGRGEFDDDDTIYSNDDICECENDREE